ncbi:hypothetical protein LCGC14_0587600 [marine sediment metagenome]|uniref:Uncharacterized protein n=1 Tax=marine sediment metagenome TaxID=412755 RepID=A0A0F9RY77_9ZZZZ
MAIFHRHNEEAYSGTWIPVTIDGERWRVSLEISKCRCGVVSASIAYPPRREVDMEKVFADALAAKPRISIHEPVEEGSADE